MAEKTLNTRIIQKHDIEGNWLKATNFIPKQGEIIVYDIDSTHDYERFKIGDGTTNINTLPFAIAVAGEKFGIVKSGGDVTIADGIISINDDSHNHSISTINGLQDALDEKVERGELEEEFLAARGNWDINDENDASYIFNRTHYIKDDGSVRKLDEIFLPDTILKKADVVNNLTSTATDVPLSAAQGAALNTLINNKTSNNAIQSAVSSFISAISVADIEAICV